MASTSKLAIFYLILIFGLFSYSHAHKHIMRDAAIFMFRNCKFQKIFQFGDSLADTGNLAHESRILSGGAGAANNLPYGETYFGRPTDRSSNGLMMIDYVAWAAGLDLLNPYKDKTANFENGVNFAVAGSTAVSVENLGAIKINGNLSTSSSLGVQVDWMADYLANLCKNDRACGDKMKAALFMVGETGGNDYNFALTAKKSFQKIKDELVPEVVGTITNATRRLISFGARKLVVPGNIPVGCLPIYLTLFQTKNSTFDKNGCLKEYNGLARYHNQHLQQALHQLRQEFPHTTIVYGDYYNAYEWIHTHARYLGFKSVQKACCGSGGAYNFGFSGFCGAPGVPVCPNPNNHMNWDGIHPTQQTNMYLAVWLISDILPMLKCY